jgi:hypothetical protein
MAERYVRNLTYPQGYERSENAINDYYNTRELELQAQYESRVRDIDERIIFYDGQIDSIDEYEMQNEELVEEQKVLLEEYERGTEGTTELIQQAEIKRNRYNALEEQWAQTESKEERDAIKDEAVRTAQEIQAIEEKIKTAEYQNRALKDNYWTNVNIIQKKVLANNKKIDQRRLLQNKQVKLDDDKNRLAQQLGRDLEKNTTQKEKELKNINIPVLTARLKKYASGPVSKNEKRLVVVPFTLIVDYPEGVSLKELSDEIYDDIEFDNLGEQYVIPNPSLMEISDTPPSGSGLDIYDYEKSSYSGDFTKTSAYIDYGVYLDYTRLPDGKHYAPPRE